MKCGASARLTVYTKSDVKLVDNFVHRVGAKRHCTHMKFFHFHLCRNRPFRKVDVELGKRNTILGQCTGLVAEKILDSAEFFR